MASKWGSFFHQAVAGVESRIDNILAEDGPENTTNATKEDKRAETLPQRNTSVPKSNLAGMWRLTTYTFGVFKN